MEMWGDAEGAYSLKPSDELAKCLFQITGPAHIPYHDDRWQQLLLHYETLVHLHNLGFSTSLGDRRESVNGAKSDDDNIGESSFPVADDIVGNACRQCAKYCPTSSNLAALTLHVARMIRDLQESLIELRDIHSNEFSGSDDSNSKTHENDDSFTTPKIQHRDGGSSESNVSSKKRFLKSRLALIGKARVTCGALNLLRILSHETIVQACSDPQIETSNGSNVGISYYSNGSLSNMRNDTNYILKESFTYRGRTGDGVVSAEGGDGHDSAIDLISSLMAFISTLKMLQQQKISDRSAPDSGDSFNPLSIPEIYDLVVQMLSLQIVLLSTQLYQPFLSSMQLAEDGRESDNFFMQKWMEYSYWQRQQYRENKKGGVNTKQQFDEHPVHSQQAIEPSSVYNGPLLFLSSCLDWLVYRPSPPKRSITAHYVDLAKSVAKQSCMIVAPDGMYESHSIVSATAPVTSTETPLSVTATMRATLSPSSSSVSTESLLDQEIEQTATAISLGTDDNVEISSKGHQPGDPSGWNIPTTLLLNPVRRIMLLSSSLLLLPVRIVRLAMELFGHSKYRTLLTSSTSMRSRDITDYDKTTLQKLHKYCENNNGWERTNNILWLTDSPIADLGSALFLLLTNNCRAHSSSSRSSNSWRNPYRAELATMNDNRWEKDSMSNDLSEQNPLLPTRTSRVDNDQSQEVLEMSILSINFESLFEAFERIAHTEIGALMLYTMLLSSPIFAASLAARSDLDTLVMPLLRTLYFSSTMTHEHHTSTTSPSTVLSAKNRPFRSQSQLYVILILLLIFSQDQSFGRISFKLLSIPDVKWYKERQIKNISLGSMILLVVLRTITFSLNRLHDSFLLSNCCAVLLNLSPHAINLHEYVAARLVSVTTSCTKRYSAMVAENGNNQEAEGDVSSLLSMHGETCRTLLQLIKHSIRPKCLEKNMHLLYSLLLEQRELIRISNSNLFKHGELESIVALMKRALDIIQKQGSGMSAEDTMDILKRNVSDIKAYSHQEGISRNRTNSDDSLASDASDLGNLTFTYEEEEDPEIFFIPYIWDVVVCSISSATIEWKRDKVNVFPLNEKVDLNVDDVFCDDEIGHVSEKSFRKDHIANTPDVV